MPRGIGVTRQDDPSDEKSGVKPKLLRGRAGRKTGVLIAAAIVLMAAVTMMTTAAAWAAPSVSSRALSLPLDGFVFPREALQLPQRASSLARDLAEDLVSQSASRLPSLPVSVAAAEESGPAARDEDRKAERVQAAGVSGTSPLTRFWTSVRGIPIVSKAISVGGWIRSFLRFLWTIPQSLSKGDSDATIDALGDLLERTSPPAEAGGPAQGGGSASEAPGGRDPAPAAIDRRASQPAEDSLDTTGS